MKQINFNIDVYNIKIIIEYSTNEEPDLEVSLYDIDFILYEIKCIAIRPFKQIKGYAETYTTSAEIFAIDDTFYPLYKLLIIRITAINGGFKIIARVYNTQLNEIFNGFWKRNEPCYEKIFEVKA